MSVYGSDSSSSYAHPADAPLDGFANAMLQNPQVQAPALVSHPLPQVRAHPIACSSVGYFVVFEKVISGHLPVGIMQ